MFVSQLLTLSLVVFAGTVSSQCTAETRLAGARQVPYAYNLIAPGASAKAFRAVPFADNCVTSIAANGLPPVVVAVDGQSTYNFALTTRQAFSRVTGEYVDFPQNRTTDIITNVTLGAAHVVPVPVTFSANVYLDYNAACRIEAVRAFAQVPSNIANLIYTNIGLDAPFPEAA